MNQSNTFAPEIKWVPLGTLTVYHVTDQELDQLEKGTPESLFLNFAVFLISTGLSFFVSLLTAEIKSLKVFCVFVVVTVIGLLGGAFLLLLWIRHHRSTRGIATSIRGRKSPEGKQTPLPPATLPP